jgi:hypothetical protein
MKTLLALLLTIALCQSASAQSHFFGSRVVRYSPGVGNALFPDPSQALGGPTGRGYSNGSLDVVTLGVQGELVLGFSGGQYLADGPGADLIVSENAFGSAAARFAELVKVAVSSNGTDFAFFPCWCGITEAVPGYSTIDSNLVSGFAGVTPVFANTGGPPYGNTIDPFNPAVAGGDAFDLSSLANDPLVTAGKVNLASIRYVLMKDVWGDGLTQKDSYGNWIFDPTGTMDPPYNDATSADIDAISIISGHTAIAGDINGDGKVSFADYLILEANFGKSNREWWSGDLNSDGKVSFGDYLILEANFGHSAPEPGLMLPVLAVLALRRKR